MISSVQFSCSAVSECNPMDCSMPGLPTITNSWSPCKPMSIESVMPSNHFILVVPFSSCPQSFPASGSFQMSHLFASCGQSIGFSASAWVLPMNIQVWFHLWSLGSSRDSQESSPTPQFKSISSSVLSFLYSPNLTSIHDYWKNHSFDYTDLYLTLLANVFHNTFPCFWFLFFLNTLSLTLVVLLDILYELVFSSSAY